MLLGLFWGPVAGARPSATVPRSEEALCDDTPAQVNGGSVRDGTCEPRLWNMGPNLTLALATSSLVLFQYVAWISSRC